jgi:hypothetical protein
MVTHDHLEATHLTHSGECVQIAPTANVLVMGQATKLVEEEQVMRLWATGLGRQRALEYAMSWNHEVGVFAGQSLRG